MTTALAVIGVVGALVLVGSGVWRRRGRGEPVARWGAIWAVLFAGAFVVALASEERL